MKILLLIVSSGFLILMGIIGAVIFSASDENSNIDTQETVQEEGIIEEEYGKYSIQEVALHNTKSDCWTIITGSVYDVTSYIENHPGGQTIATACGIDASEKFKNQNTPSDLADEVRIDNNIPLDREFHTPYARSVLDGFKIGEVQ